MSYNWGVVLWRWDCKLNAYFYNDWKETNNEKKGTKWKVDVLYRPRRRRLDQIFPHPRVCWKTWRRHSFSCMKAFIVASRRGRWPKRRRRGLVVEDWCSPSSHWRASILRWRFIVFHWSFRFKLSDWNCAGSTRWAPNMQSTSTSVPSSIVT